MELSINYKLFIHRIIMLSFYKIKENMSYEDIGYILNRSPEVIKLYDEELIKKHGIAFYEARRS